jgi:hypothetical protein
VDINVEFMEGRGIEIIQLVENLKFEKVGMKETRGAS